MVQMYAEHTLKTCSSAATYGAIMHVAACGSHRLPNASWLMSYSAQQHVFLCQSPLSPHGSACQVAAAPRAQDQKQEQRAKRQRLLSAAASARIRRGMIRYLQARPRACWEAPRLV